jgi:hypothetical protein
MCNRFSYGVSFRYSTVIFHVAVYEFTGRNMASEIFQVRIRSAEIMEI